VAGLVMLLAVPSLGAAEPLERSAAPPVAGAWLHSQDTEASQDCTYARKDAERSADALSFAARGLTQCVDRGGQGDACHSAFFAVRSAHGDYSAAVSRLRQVCR